MNYRVNLFHIRKFLVIYLVLSLGWVKAQSNTPEATIHKAYNQDKTSEDQIHLHTVNQKLDSIFKVKDNTFNRYWLSYGLYNQALIADWHEKKEDAEVLIDRAINLLKPLKGDAESQALLSLQLGYSTRFKSYWAMASLGRDALFHAERAVELNPNNLRTNLALAINDFYTPKFFGGGKKVEYHLKEALAAPVTSSKDSLPTWGKSNVYKIIVKHYRKIEKDSIAQDYLNQGLQEFTESEMLQVLYKNPKK